MLLIKNARLIEELTEGFEIKGLSDVLIEGNKISKIRPAGFDFGEIEDVLDINGKTLMPGLWDLHAHMYLQSQTCNTDVIMKNVGEELFGCYNYAKEYLKQGYTTIRDCGSVMDTNILVRDAINRGDLKGPRVIACGIIITPTEVGNNTFPILYAEVDGPDELRKVARRELQKGADFIKYMGTGAYTNKDGRPGDTIASVAELKAVQEAVEIKNTYVAVHAHGADCIEKCIDIGVRTIEHGTHVSDKAIEMLLKQAQPKSFIIPTFALWDAMIGDDPQGLVKNGNCKTELVYYAFSRWETANKAGLKLGWGTDGCMTDFVARPGLEFHARKTYSHMGNMDMLLQATKNSAEIAGYGDVLGTVKEGKIADLIVVNGNPDENIEAMYQLADNVIRDGELLI